jgi:zeaxanthin glucosyltransferase
LRRDDCSALPINIEPGVPPYFTHWRPRDRWWSRQRNQLANLLFYLLVKENLDLISSQRKKWGLVPYANPESFNSPLAIMAQLPKELDFHREKIEPWFHYVGPIQNSRGVEPISDESHAFNESMLDGRPVLYANLGTLQSRKWDVFTCIAEACTGLNVQLIISLGNPNAIPSEANFPGNPLVFSYPPHQQLIGLSSLVITHAGSTAVSCLSKGIPIVAIPLAVDQPGMAARVVEAGAGEAVPLSSLSVSKLKTAIEMVLNGPSYKEKALRLQSAIRESGGLGYAADIIESVLSAQEPAYSRDFSKVGLVTEISL